MTTEDQPVGLSEAEDLTRMITAICNGHDALAIGFALSTVLAGLLVEQTRQQAAAMRGTPRRTGRALKRHHLKLVAEMLQPLDEIP